MNKIKYLALAPVLAASAAYAALPESVGTQIDAAKTDGMAVGWLMIGVLAGFVVFGLIRKVMR